MYRRVFSEYFGFPVAVVILPGLRTPLRRIPSGVDTVDLLETVTPIPEIRIKTVPGLKLVIFYLLRHKHHQAVR
jgi:hypothetical protein